MKANTPSLLLALCWILGCAQFKPSAAIPFPEAPAHSCESLAMIEDGEDQDDRALVRAGRGGYFYTYTDEEGTTISPKDNKFGMTPGGANGSSYAVRVRGALASSEKVYAGVGLSFLEPKAPYDAARYQGLAFFARKGSPDAASSVRVKVPDLNTDPSGGLCTECYNDFGVDFQVTTEWTRFVVGFADLSQETGWGSPRPETLSSQIYGMQWQVATSGAHYDLWIDDVTFLGCP